MHSTRCASAPQRAYRSLEPQAHLRRDPPRRREVELGVADLALGRVVTIVAQVPADDRQVPALDRVRGARVVLRVGLGEEVVAALERPPFSSWRFQVLKMEAAAKPRRRLRRLIEGTEKPVKS